MRRITLLTASSMLVCQLVAQAQDFRLAPNSYIFDPYNTPQHDGILIPVKKAYAMWSSDTLISDNTSAIPPGIAKAEVLWEDEKGLIRCGADYRLTIVGTGENAKIKVPINKAKTGNAVIVYKVDDVIYWSWHVWVTDDPTNGTNYRAYTEGSIQRMLANGQLNDIPESELKFMDRNLGATGYSATGNKRHKSGGLLYQWGRKDPFPPLVTKGDDFYEVSGSIGRVRHRHDHTYSAGTKFDDLRLHINRSDAWVKPNLITSIRNPASLIFIVNDNTTNQAFYNGNPGLPLNWFGRSTTLSDSQLTQLNLWSDNSKGIIPNPPAHNYNSQRGPYRNKSSWDPCPNGWRIPSMFTAALGNWSYRDDIRSDFAPFGYNTATGNIKLNGADSLEKTIYPHDEHSPIYKNGVKVIPNLGFDMTNVNGKNMGHFPGTGVIHRNLALHGAQYTDQHEVHIWTATMARWFDASPAVLARKFYAVPDAEQWINSYRPDASHYPNVWGLYEVKPLATAETSEAAACRCISDPLYILNNYNFPTEYFSDGIVDFREGLDDPNTYALTKATQPQLVTIPISKAFSVQSHILGNADILDPSSFDELKVNVHWTTNPNLVRSLSLSGQPGSLSDLNSINILAEIKEDEAGSAVISLHNGSITNPVMWSWHIWVTNTPIDSITYTTQAPEPDVQNYRNYVKKGISLTTMFMDRDLGALTAFPTVANPANPSPQELEAIKSSGGFQYQWGRKDPLPPFLNPDGSTYDIYLGAVQADGSINYTTLNAATYNSIPGAYIIPYSSYAAAAGVSSSDKIDVIIEKNIRYAVEHPLEYLIPSAYVPFNGANGGVYANGTDWVIGANESNVAPDRWGRADKKSPFDPCPRGWRIPDVMTTLADTVTSMNPWNKQQLSAAQTDIENQYYGTAVGSYGFIFNHPDYKIGNYATVGARGMRSVMFNGGQPSYTPSVSTSATAGWWTAALASHQYGRGIALTLRDINKQIKIHNNDIDPAAALNCRCVRESDDALGDPDWTGTPVSIRLEAFSATCEDKVKLYWRANDNDHSFDHYEVFKSTDARVWQKLATVSRKSDEHQNEYFLYDEKAHDKTFYMLRMVYLDGTKEHSAIKATQCSSQQETWTVYPNPGGNQITLSLYATANGQDILTMSDITGRIVHQQKLVFKQGPNSFTIDLNKVNNGLYILQLTQQQSLYPALKFTKID